VPSRSTTGRALVAGGAYGGHTRSPVIVARICQYARIRRAQARQAFVALVFLTMSSDIVLHGTLIIPISTAEGFVICADKRLSASNGHHVDTDTKILSLGSNAAFSINGDCKWVSAMGEVMFDAEAIVRGYFDGKSITNITDHLAVGDALIKSFRGYLARRQYSEWPATSSDQSLFQVPIFYFDTNSQMTAAVLEFKYTKRMPPELNVTGTNWSPKVWNVAHWEPMGDLAVVREIIGGRDNRFDDIRQDSTFKLLMSNSTSVRQLSAQTAAAFGRRVIRLTNERASIVVGSRGLVSADSDCALLRQDGKLVFLP
jgi:hypothetical protein